MHPGRSQIPALIIITITGIVFFHVNVGIETQVNCTATRNGGNADLMCKIPSDMDIVQITWQKSTANSYETLVAQSKRFGVEISKPYENRLSVLNSKEPGTSAIALSQLEKEDGACFTAIFNIFPDGALKGEVCLPKLQTSNSWKKLSWQFGQDIENGKNGTTPFREDVTYSHHEKNRELAIARTKIPSILAAVPLFVVIIVIWFILVRKQHNFSKKEDKAEEGFSTPLKHHNSINEGSPGTEIKQRKGSTVKKNRENIQLNKYDNIHTLINMDKNVEDSLESEVKQKKGSAVKKNKENLQQNNSDCSCTPTNEQVHTPCKSNVHTSCEFKVMNETPGFRSNQRNSSGQKEKNKSVRRLFD